VRAFLGRILERGQDLRALGRIALATIGPATAEALAAFHLRTDVVPESYRSESLADSLQPRVTGRRVLLARADRGRTILQDRLRDVTERVEQVAVYRNVDVAGLPPDLDFGSTAQEIDWITLTSPAIAERLHALAPAWLHDRIEASQTRLATISPVTSATVKKLGWPVGAEADTYTWQGLVIALVAAASRPVALGS
jgi:uroporphyrinogen III methyltransferase/synthase